LCSARSDASSVSSIIRLNVKVC